MLFYITLSLTFTVKVCHTTSIGIFLTHFFKYYTQGIPKLLHYFMLKNSFWTLSIYIINNPHLVTVYALNYHCIIIKQISCMNTGHRKRVFCHCVQKECVGGGQLNHLAFWLPGGGLYLKHIQIVYVNAQEYMHKTAEYTW